MAETEILDKPEARKLIDQGGMLAVVSQFPELLEQAGRFVVGVDLPKLEAIDQILILGMGGSAIAGDIVADLYQKKLAATIMTSRHYNLPGYVNAKTLVFALSYSGETEETLSAVKEAENKGATIVCITSGGKLKEIAANRKAPLFLIPSGYQPRAALPFLLIPLLVSLEKLGLISGLNDELKEVQIVLKKLREEIGPDKATRTNPAKLLAKKMAGKIPVIFGAYGTTGSAALRLKTQLNENSKATAVLNIFPELNHNEIVNLSFLKKEDQPYYWIILRDEGDNERIKKRIEITKSLLSRQLGGATEIVSQGKSHLARLLSLIFYADLLSVYLALASGFDPTPVEIITRLKKEMVR